MTRSKPTKSEPGAGVSGFGPLLRECRAARRMSQLELSLGAELSSRHLSYIETGKAQPSREMVSRLADTLELPLRERNALLLAAGFAPKYPETALSAPEMAQVRRAIDFILSQQEPYPAFVLNRRWDILMSNTAAMRVNRAVMGGRDSAHANMIRQIFDPNDLRGAVVNWTEVAGDLIRHLQDEMAASPTDAAARNLLEEALRYPGVPAHWRVRELGLAPPPLLTAVLRGGGREFRFFSTITTFGTPRDVTVDDLHIECCFPMDEATIKNCRALAREG